MPTHPLLQELEQDPSAVSEQGEWSLRADGAEVGPIGVKADALHLRRRAPSGQSAPALGEALARRARYLLEPLEVVESSPEQAILRSMPPAPAPDECDYYEMRVRDDALEMERYHGARGQRREQRPLNLTWEQAERLVRDVESVYDEPPVG